MSKSNNLTIQRPEKLHRLLPKLEKSPWTKKINGPYGPYSVRHHGEIPLVGIERSDDESSTINKNSIIGKLLDHEDYYPEDITPKEVSHTPFLIKSTAFGNLSGDEENFDENRTWRQVKIESVNPSDVTDSETEKPPENPKRDEEEENQDPQNWDDWNMDLNNYKLQSNSNDKTGQEPTSQLRSSLDASRVGLQ